MEFYKAGFIGFFCIVFAVFWRLKERRHRLTWLLAASAVFYLSFNPWFLLLLVASTSIDYLLALGIHKETRPGRRKLLLAASVTTNLAILAFFKYLLFFLATTRAAFGLFGLSLNVPPWSIILPLGISFYTFEAISYVVDVYKGKIEPFRSPRDYALYILFFPHLLAGPIVRTHDFAPQLARTRRFSWLRCKAGVQLFLLGLLKKAVLADRLAEVIEPIFAGPGQHDSLACWLGMFGYTLQVYGDFSGYSDMALGLAQLLGFRLPTNFRQPYFSSSMGEFWRRWHMSLSDWLRDYLFIPLGGSRGQPWLVYRNLMLTMTLAGLWHGASWNCVLWGAYNGVLLCLERAFPLPAALRATWMRPFWIACTFTVHSLGLVVFRSANLQTAGTMLSRLFVPGSGTALPPVAVFVVVAALVAVFVDHLLAGLPPARKLWGRLPAPVSGAVLATALTLFFLLLPGKGSGFIYFQF
jgi:alginate O-acetyltransferase complex protein AlgI